MMSNRPKLQIVIEAIKNLKDLQQFDYKFIREKLKNTQLAEVEKSTSNHHH